MTIKLIAAALFLSLSATAESPGNATAGKAVFQQNCAICHGATGQGDGAAAAGLNPKPANFSRRASTEEKQLRVVTNGGASEKLSPQMPAFGEVLSAQQLRDVIAFVRSANTANR